MTALEIVAPGPLTLVQDLGRPGYADRGISPSGALDRHALQAVNRVLGNREGEAGLEIVLGGAVLRARGDLMLAVAGAAGPITLIGGAGRRPAAWAAPVLLSDGECIELGPALFGVRYVVGVRGGLQVPTTLGSASSDRRSGIGPPALAAGDVIQVGSTGAPVPIHEIVPVVPPAGDVCLHALPGPRDDVFHRSAVRAFFEAGWTVAAASDRVGLRLDGPLLERRSLGELPSEGMVTGAVQVTPAGPIVFLADHPTTGGYPVIAVVDAADLDLAGQVRPGQVVRFAVGSAPSGIRPHSPRMPAS